MRQLSRSATRSVAALGALALIISGASTALGAPTLTSVAPAALYAGQQATFTGSTNPVAPGAHVRVEQQVSGTWRALGTPAVVAEDGAWTVTAAPSRRGLVRAVLLADGSVSAEQPLPVRVRVLARSVPRTPIYPFLGTKLTWRIAPMTYSGPVRVQLTLDRRDAGWVRATARRGVVVAHVPTNGVGLWRARLDVPANAEIDGTSDAQLTYRVAGVRVTRGASATWVRSLRAGLAFRGIYVPKSGGFGTQLGDSVVAFHKAYRRPRTTTFEASDWRLLSHSRIKPRFGGRGLHIEIDKARQLLMQVRNGRVTMAIHVSSGATGNTPVGTHRIQWKGNWVPSLYGGMLYKSMAFQGTFAIHGYPSVPTTPASHGCVRVPMWIAATLYARSPVGTPVYVYEGPGSTSQSIGRRAADPAARAAADVPELTGVDVDRWADERG